MNKQLGFTLLEVMVALFIIAITLGAIINNNASSTRNGQYLQAKTLAALVAQNEMVKTRTAKTLPRNSNSSGNESMANTEWHWTKKVSKTDDPLLRRIDIAVSQNDDREQVLFRLTGFMAQPQ